MNLRKTNQLLHRPRKARRLHPRRRPPQRRRPLQPRRRSLSRARVKMKKRRRRRLGELPERRPRNPPAAPRDLVHLSEECTQTSTPAQTRTTTNPTNQRTKLHPLPSPPLKSQNPRGNPRGAPKTQGGTQNPAARDVQNGQGAPKTQGDTQRPGATQNPEEGVEGTRATQNSSEFQKGLWGGGAVRPPRDPL